MCLISTNPAYTFHFIIMYMYIDRFAFLKAYLKLSVVNFIEIINRGVFSTIPLGS